MADRALSDGWNDLVEELKELEDYFPMLGVNAHQDDLQEEVRELEALIAGAGEATDDHSMKALAFLQAELLRKKALLDGY